MPSQIVLEPEVRTKLESIFSTKKESPNKQILDEIFKRNENTQRVPVKRDINISSIAKQVPKALSSAALSVTPIGPAVEAMRAIKPLGQAMEIEEATVAAPVVEGIQALKNKRNVGGAIKKGLVRGITGESKYRDTGRQVQLGDIGRELGAPEIVSQVGGLAGSAFLPSSLVLGKIGQKAAPVVTDMANKSLKKYGMITSDVAGRIIDSVVKPLKKDFAYGKRPGFEVARQGIVANSLDELAQKVSTRKNQIGQAIQQAVSDAKAKIDIDVALNPIRKQINKLKEFPRQNKAAIDRLLDIQDDIMAIERDEVGNIISNRKLFDVTPSDALDLKTKIGDLTKWTGNPTDDKVVNKALKQVYGALKEKINNAVPKVRGLNEQYSNLLSADVAARYRDVINQRQALAGFSEKTLGVGGALVGSLVSGGSALPTIVSGLSTAALVKALKSPAVKTRIAQMIAGSGKQALKTSLKASPKFRKAFEIAYRTVGRKTLPSLANFMKEITA